MTAQRNDLNDQNIHQTVWQLLPWYVNGTLSSEERSQVDAHVATCRACDHERARCENLTLAVKAQEQATWAPTPKHFASVLAHVEAREPKHKVEFDWRARLNKFTAWFQGSPRSMRFAFAFQGALVLTLAGALVLQAQYSAPRMYETLSRADSEVNSSQVQVRMVFAEKTSEKELRELLRGIGASIVDGPSSVGVYTVQMPTTGVEDLHRLLAAVRAHSNVRLAEPVSRQAAP